MAQQSKVQKQIRSWTPAEKQAAIQDAISEYSSGAAPAVEKVTRNVTAKFAGTDASSLSVPFENAGDIDLDMSHSTLSGYMDESATVSAEQAGARSAAELQNASDKAQARKAAAQSEAFKQLAGSYSL